LRRSWYPAVLVLLIGGTCVFVWSNTRPEKIPPPPPRPYQSYSGLNGTFVLLPVGHGAGAATRPSTPSPADAWKQVMDGLPADPQSQQLATRMFGGVPVQIAIATSPAEAQSAPWQQQRPAPPAYIGVRLGPISSFETSVNGKKIFKPNLACNIIVWVPDMNRTVGGGVVYPAGSTSPSEELPTILVTDYCLRHGLPYALSWETQEVYNAKYAPPWTKDVDTLRKAIDERIDKFIGKDGAFYGGLRPR
jgi:hypothetical protein